MSLTPYGTLYYARPRLVKALEQIGLTGSIMHLLQLRRTARGDSDVVAYKLGVKELVRVPWEVADARWYLRVGENRVHCLMPKACRHSDAGEEIYKKCSLQQLHTLIEEMSKVQLLQDYGASNDYWKMNCDA